MSQLSASEEFTPKFHVRIFFYSWIYWDTSSLRPTSFACEDRSLSAMLHLRPRASRSAGITENQYQSQRLNAHTATRLHGHTATRLHGYTFCTATRLKLSNVKGLSSLHVGQDHKSSDLSLWGKISRKCTCSVAPAGTLAVWRWRVRFEPAPEVRETACPIDSANLTSMLSDFEQRLKS